ncbi:restriction endonuclease subunit S [Streptomyces albogriseolus]|uniref:restriction endonuclease subunit S n=1 Tax=Streptomyces albogriseolus TaxID=1887 RepID=UPI003CF2B6A9
MASNLVDPADYPDLPHIAPNNIKRQTGKLLPYNTVAEDGVTSPKHLFHAGQVLYSKIRPYLAKSVIARFDGLCSADMYPVDTTLLPEYLNLWILHPEFTRLASGEQARTVLPKINKRALARLPVPVAPPKEQQRIVKALEEHLSLVDAGVAYLETAKRRARGLTKAVLADLIPDSSDYPASWESTTVAKAGTVELGRQRHPDWHTGPNMRPYLRVANVFEDRIDTSDLMEMHWPEETFERFRLMPGDILLNEGQSPEWLGRPAIYRGMPEEVAFTNSLLRFKAREDVLPEFALLVFRRHMHTGRFKQESRITTNIAHLSATRLKKVEFPVPPLDEQQQIIESATLKLDAVKRLEAEIAVSERKAESLRRSLLVATFSGKLVTGSDVAETEAVETLMEEIASTTSEGALF